jgi:hypothetical protein
MLVTALGRPAAASTPINEHIVAVLQGYPLDGRIPYAWRAGEHLDGVTRALSWQGTLVAAPSPAGAVHCSGITFEVYVQALERAQGGQRGLSSAALLSLKESWYVRDGRRAGPAGALLAAGLGQSIDRVEDLKPGDIVQFWRNSGRGHSAIVTGHTYRRSGAVRGIEFWSAQSSSGGLGRRFVSVGPSEHQITPGQLFAVRPTLPTPAAGDGHPQMGLPSGPEPR